MRGGGWAIRCAGKTFDGYATRSATSLHGSSFPMVQYMPPPSLTASPCTEDSFFFPRVLNNHIDSAPVRKDNASHASQFARPHRHSRAKRRYPRCSPVAAHPASPRPNIPPRARTTRRRRQRDSALRRHRTVRAARRTMGPARPNGDVRAHGVFRRAVRRIPELRAGFVR